MEKIGKGESQKLSEISKCQNFEKLTSCHSGQSAQIGIMCQWWKKRGSWNKWWISIKKLNICNTNTLTWAPQLLLEYCAVLFMAPVLINSHLYVILRFYTRISQFLGVVTSNESHIVFHTLYITKIRGPIVFLPFSNLAPPPTSE